MDNIPRTKIYSLFYSTDWSKYTIESSDHQTAEYVGIIHFFEGCECKLKASYCESMKIYQLVRYI